MLDATSNVMVEERDLCWHTLATKQVSRLQLCQMSFYLNLTDNRGSYNRFDVTEMKGNRIIGEGSKHRVVVELPWSVDQVFSVELKLKSKTKKGSLLHVHGIGQDGSDYRFKWGAEAMLLDVLEDAVRSAMKRDDTKYLFTIHGHTAAETSKLMPKSVSVAFTGQDPPSASEPENDFYQYQVARAAKAAKAAKSKAAPKAACKRPATAKSFSKSKLSKP